MSNRARLQRHAREPGYRQLLAALHQRKDTAGNFAKARELGLGLKWVGPEGREAHGFHVEDRATGTLLDGPFPSNVEAWEALVRRMA